MPPAIANGKICYIEMPSKDVAGSESFYRKVFGWNIRRRGDGSVAFDDAAGEVSGAWTASDERSGVAGVYHGGQRCGDASGGGGERGRDCATDRCGCPGDYGVVSGSVGERVGVVSGAGEKRQLGNCLPRAGRPAVCEAARREYSE